MSNRQARAFDFSDKPLSKSEFLRKYGRFNEPELISVPIEVGRNEAEQLIFSNVNQLIKAATLWFSGETIFQKQKNYELKRATVLAVTSMVASMVLSVAMIFIRKRK